METINDRVARLIDALGITRASFARRMNVSPTVVTRYCKGEVAIMDRTIADICREFGVSETWLRTGEGDMFPPRDALQEMTEMAGWFLGNQPTEIQQRAARMLFNLRPEDWELIEQRARELLGE